jgi:hypothetical protein
MKRYLWGSRNVRQRDGTRGSRASSQAGRMDTRPWSERSRELVLLLPWPNPAGAVESRAFDLVDDVGTAIARTLAVQFTAAELFYVSANMTDLARHAGLTLADYRLHPEDLPAQVGLMLYEHPPVEGTGSARHDDITVVF